MPSAAGAARADRQAFDARATITDCRGDGLTLAAQIAPAANDSGRRVARLVRGASLRLRFEALPLHGRARARRTVEVGRVLKARRRERFERLRAQAYVGVVTYRWVRGGRTITSGVVRARDGRAAGRRGKAVCALQVGRRPRDTRPPFILPLPFDDGWKRGPLDVFLYAVDDLSGVALVGWRVDDGPVGWGRTLQVASEGSHRLDYGARDAAGNQTPLFSVTLRVDMNPPSVPTITAPTGPTATPRPEVRWTEATDTASGVQGYVALVRDPAGVIVWSQFVPAGAPTAVTVGQDLAPNQYTAEVVAIDGAAPEPFTSKATSSFSVS